MRPRWAGASAPIGCGPVTRGALSSPDSGIRMKLLLLLRDSKHDRIMTIQHALIALPPNGGGDASFAGYMRDMSRERRCVMRPKIRSRHSGTAPVAKFTLAAYACLRAGPGIQQACVDRGVWIPGSRFQRAPE